MELEFNKKGKWLFETKFDKKFILDVFGLTDTMKAIIVSNVIKDIGKKIEDEWLDKLKDKLNDSLHPSKWHKKRFPRSRLFPYRNTGELQNALNIDVDINKLSAEHYQLVFWFEILVKQAFFTNYGIAGKNKSIDAKWVGWAESVLVGNGRANVKSVKVIFNEYFTSKRLGDLVRAELYRRGTK